MTRIQLALDIGGSAKLLELAERVSPFVDWIEAGTPLILAEGIGVVGRLREHLPDKPIVADLKIIDAGAHEADLAFSSGAAFVTVLGVASDATVMEVVRSARRAGARVIADMLSVVDPLARAKELGQMGVDFICLHTGADEASEGLDPVAEAVAEFHHESAHLVVAGGISPQRLPRLREVHPAVVVVGRAITEAEDPVRVAAGMRQTVDAWAGEEDEHD